MDFYSAIDSRRTIRDFEDVQIDKETLDRIISAGLKAPTNDHMRDWHFIVIDDKKVVQKLLETIPVECSAEEIRTILQDWNLKDELQRSMYISAIPKQYRMLYDASCVIIPLLKEKTNIMHPDNLSSLNGFASIWCCIENIFLASTAEGYACTLRIPLGDEANHARKVLDFPEDYFMPCFIGLGKPSEDATYAKQKPYELEDRIHKNKW